jgi:hypothetical protein
MIPLALDALLLYGFAIYIVMQYRILPIDGTPYWLFGILFFILTAHVGISFYPAILGKAKKHLNTVKNILLWATLAITLGGVSITAMVDRAKTAPVYGAHDIILQQEAAMRYLIVGKNPYTETYFGTPVESFHYAEEGDDKAVNPALYHFVMPPWYLVFPFTFYYSVRPMVGFFDARFASLFCMVGLLVIISLWFKHPQTKRLAITITALSPATFGYFLEGRSDVFALFWLVFALWLLEKRKFIWSAAILALAFMSKQTTWFIAPFFALWTWIEAKGRIPTIAQMLAIFTVVIAMLCVPFILWDSKGFFDGVIFYLSGNAAHSYPISGYGLSMVLKDMGVIPNNHAYYPFGVWQALLGLPALGALLWWMKKKWSMSTMLVAYAVFLSIVWYTSRYFNNSHLAYISMLLGIGLIKDMDETINI